MTKRLISFFLAFVLLVVVPLSARYRYNPYTKKLDFYEAAGDIVLGDIGDITLTGLATGNILYYNGTAWANLATGANTNVLTLAGGIPSWAAPGAPAAHAASHEVGGADLVDHDQLTNYLAAQHLTLPNTLVAVLTDHNAGAHTALGFVVLPSTIAAVLTDHNKAAHDALLIDADTVDGEHAGAIVTNARVKAHFPDTIANVLSDHNLLAHTALGLYDAPGDVDHNLTTNYAANQHVVLPATIAAVLTDHDLAAHTALGLFDASGDVDHDATTNWVANKHIDWTAAASNFSTSENFTLAWDDAADYAEIVQMNAAGIADRPLININDDRTGVTADTVGEATIVMNAAGVYGLYMQTGQAYFADDTTQIEDVFITWADAADHMFIDQNSESGVEDQALVRIEDSREGATIDEISEASLRIDGEGYGLVVIAKTYFEGAFAVKNIFEYDRTTDHNLLVGYLAGQDLTAGQGTYNTLFGEEAGADITTGDYNIVIGYQTGNKLTTNNDNILIGTGIASVSASQAHSNVIIGRTAAIELTNGYENVILGKEAARDIKSAGLNVIIGWQASLEHETGNSNVVIGSQAGVGVAASSNYGFNTIVGANAGQYVLTAGANNVLVGYQAAQDLTTGAGNVVIGYMAGEGWLDTESNLLVVDNTDTTTPLIYGDFNADNITFNGDFNVTMDAALDQIVFAQSAVAGTEDQPLIFIDDDRVGATVDEPGEASIVIDADGTYAMTILDGLIWLDPNTGLRSNQGTILLYTETSFIMGTTSEWTWNWDSNGAADTIMRFQNQNIGADETTAIFWSQLNPSGMTDHDNYTSPTLIMTNDEGADAYDYAGVVIGERGQADVKVAHYFDFYAMTGAADGSVASPDELAAIFRFGANGTGVPGYSTTGGDVLMEGALEIDGNQQNAGYNRYDYIYWIESFDHGIAANRYSQMWDITSLNTQGNGTNTIDTTPSHITLTTDNNAVGDNEGTITYKQIILRSRLNRSEFSVDLGQTANTQFYCGWNTSQTNAMVAAADEYVIVFFDVSDNANWQIKVGDGATEDVFTSAVAGDTNEIRHEIWVEADGTVHWRVNGTELDITGSVDNLMTANGHYLIVCQAQSVTGAAAIVAEMCYVENEKTKAN